jgi:hypothetical protein
VIKIIILFGIIGFLLIVVFFEIYECIVYTAKTGVIISYKPIQEIITLNYNGEQISVSRSFYEILVVDDKNNYRIIKQEAVDDGLPIVGTRMSFLIKESKKIEIDSIKRS